VKAAPRAPASRRVIRPALAEDAYAIESRLREADLDELDAGDPLLTTPLEALQRGIAQSKVARTLVLGGVPEAVWGVVDEGDGIGRIWLLGAPRTTEDRRFFLAESAYQLQDLATGFVEVYNLVDERYDQALRWLDWLGFRPIGRCQAMMSGLPLKAMAWRVPDGACSSAGDHSGRDGRGRGGDGVLRIEEAGRAEGGRGPG
jgi:hypothetical protein